jgi:hypothetical protein
MLDKWDKFSKLREMFAVGYENAQRIKKEIFPPIPLNIWMSDKWMSDKWKLSSKNKKEITIDYIKPLEKSNWIIQSDKYYEV